jgi:3-phosphoinositide dependent protein kinase-1
MDPAHKISPANFMFGSTLGEGSYARVVHVKLKGGDEFAAKIMEKRFIRKEKKSKFVMMEKEVLAKIAHERVVKLYFTFQVIARRRSKHEVSHFITFLGSKTQNCCRPAIAKDSLHLFMVMELCHGGELLDVIM